MILKSFISLFLTVTGSSVRNSRSEAIVQLESGTLQATYPPWGQPQRPPVVHAFTQAPYTYPMYQQNMQYYSMPTGTGSPTKNLATSTTLANPVPIHPPNVTHTQGMVPTVQQQPMTSKVQSIQQPQVGQPQVSYPQAMRAMNYNPNWQMMRPQMSPQFMMHSHSLPQAVADNR